MTDPARRWRRPRHFTVVGAGLAGSTMALLLAERGHTVELLERRADPRGADTAEGRSINLALSTRGFAALDSLGLGEAVRTASVPMPGRMIHDRAGTTHFQPYTADGRAIHSVERRNLAGLLLDRAEAHPGVTIRFGTTIEEIDLDASDGPGVEVATRSPDGSSERHHTGTVIGADGAGSMVRSAIARATRFDFSRTHLDHGYKELVVPPRPDRTHSLDPNALHIWPRGDRMAIALPNTDGTFTATLFWPHDGPTSFATVGVDEVRGVFEETYADLVPLIPDLESQFRDGPVGSLATVRCSPWWYRDRAVLIGDAAHAIVPFYGQGANAALEDAVLLDEHLQSVRPDVDVAFAAFATVRKPDTDALADLTLDNFVEMRDLVGSPLFRARRRFEQILGRIAPGTFEPLYPMVTFSRMPYAEARRRSERQRRLVDVLLGAGLALAVAVGGTMMTRSETRR